MTPDLNPKAKTTTIGDLATAFYEEALREFGDEKVAEEVSTVLLREHLARRR